VIGRGGVGYWVDLRLHAAADVSREHLRIRRDPSTGRFFLKDLSTYGTTLDGVPVPRSIEVVDGEKRDLDIEVPLPDRAKLELAGMIVLQFERHEGR
jgi:pSer/pThr/pTyr-binding forkhead associated (FHA) protein